LLYQAPNNVDTNETQINAEIEISQVRAELEELKKQL